MKTAPHSSIQDIAKSYLEKHNIEEILNDIVNTITHVRMENPIPYMIKYLAIIHGNKQELQSEGIHIEDKQLINPVLFIPYPSFKAKQILQQTFDKESFLACKNKYTTSMGTLRQIIKISMEYPDIKDPKDSKTIKEPKPRLYMIDPDSYVKYEPLVTPLLKRIIRNHQPSFQYQRPNDALTLRQMQLAFPTYELIKPYIHDCQIKLKRNYHNTKFNNTMTARERAELTQSMAEWLSELKFKVQDLSNFNNKRINIKKDKKGPRYPDWPKNRSIATKPDLEQVAVFLNKEDHIEYRSSKQDLLEGLRQAWDFSDKFEQSLSARERGAKEKSDTNPFDAAFSPQHGFITVKPQDLGLGLSLRFKLKIEHSVITKFGQNIKQNPYFTLKKDVKKDTRRMQWTLTLASPVQLNRVDLLEELDKFLRQLFGELIDIPVTQIDPSSQVAINIEERKANDFDRMEIEDDSDNFADHSADKNQVANRPFPLFKIIGQLKGDVIFHQIHGVNEPAFVVRRNLVERDQDPDKLLQSIVTKYSFSTSHYKKPDDINKQVTSLLEQYDIENDVSKEEFVYKSPDKKIYIFTRKKDDYLILYRDKRISISQSLYNLAAFLYDFESIINVSYQPQVGYLTSSVQYQGLGVSIIQVLPIAETVNGNSDIEVRSAANNSKVFELVHITSSSLQEYCKLVNRNLFVIKNSNSKSKQKADYALLDCFSQAPDLSAYSILREEMLKIIKTKQKSVKHGILKPILLQDLEKPLSDFDDSLFISPIKLLPPLRPNTKLVKVECTINRNFQDYNFTSNLPFSELKQLSLSLEKFFLKETFNKIQGKKLLEKQTYTSTESKVYYRSPSIYVITCATNNLSVHFSSIPADLVARLKEIGEILTRVQTEVGQFAKMESFGYLGPHFHESLMSGISFKFQVNESSKHLLHDLCEKYEYSLAKTHRDIEYFIEHIPRVDEDTEQTQSLLEEQVDTVDTITLSSSELPRHIVQDLEFLTELTNLL